MTSVWLYILGLGAAILAVYFFVPDKKAKQN